MRPKSKRPKTWTFTPPRNLGAGFGQSKSTLMRGPLAPGGGFVIDDNGFLVLHVWGVEKAVEFGNHATIVADYAFWMTLFRTLRRVVLSPAVRRAAHGVASRAEMNPDGLLRLPDGSTLDTKEPLVRMALEEYRIWLENHRLIVPKHRIPWNSPRWDRVNIPSRSAPDKDDAARTHIHKIRRTYGKSR